MPSNEEIRASLENSVLKLKVNREKVPLADLQTKYKKSYDKLIDEIKELTKEYLTRLAVDGFKISSEDGDEVIAEFQKLADEVGRKASEAVFKSYSVSELEAVAGDLKKRFEEVYTPYFNKHCCLWITEENLNPDNPKAPWIYNDLIDMFWSFDYNRWEKRKKPEGEAAFMYIHAKKETEHDMA